MPEARLFLQLGTAEPAGRIGPSGLASFRTQAYAAALGADALWQVRAAGGWVFAQTPRTAEYPDMPHHAILTGCVDRVLPPEQIGRELLRLATEQGSAWQR